MILICQCLIIHTGKLFVHYFANTCDIDLFKGVPDWEDTCSQTLGVEPALGDPALQNKFIFTLRNNIVLEHNARRIPPNS